MTLEDRVADVARSTIDGVNAWYDWHVNPTHLPPGITLPQGNDYAQNVALKIALSQQWQVGDVDRRLELAYYYVALWGGVRAIKKDTLLRYVTTPPEKILADGPTGVASWSKVLCIVDPNKYAIFDARVSTALNSLQVIHDVRQPVLFPLLKSRNKKIEAGQKVILKHSKSHSWPAVGDAEFYKRYLGLLRSAGEKTGNQIYAIEMALFVKAGELLDQAFPQLAS